MNKTAPYILQFRRFCSIKPPQKSIKPLKNLVPENPFESRIDPQKLPSRTKIDADTIALLERLSLVDCANKKGIETLEAAIEFADQIQQVDTTGVEPLITVLEDIPLRLREDEVTDGNCKEIILENASFTEEDYFVAPPGNIPLESREDLLFEREPNEPKHHNS
ncbi:glutamyl-tRNA(Gln) amidotransferase subunit C, mitochondrial [Euwallacea similis]|uniref:glutamyl-tRNA(Gln) amidotransferase subunit C, mitochondrial n=1 Tax=Euwallacea similis TaxID=1736056 RepID=UPI00344E5219